MHDLKTLEEKRNVLEESLKKRNEDIQIISDLLQLNSERKKLTATSEAKRAEIKKLSADFGKTMKESKTNGGAEVEAELKELKDKVSSAKAELEKLNTDLEAIQKNIQEQLATIPNTLEDEVPMGADESNNTAIKSWGQPREFSFEPKDHVALGEDLDMLDFETAAKVTGSRFCFYRADLAKLERALINFMIDEHTNNGGYTEVFTPFIAHERSLFGTGQLPKFKDDAFKIEGRDWYLIPTAEVTLTNLKRDSVFSAKEFPLKYCAFSACFRSEAGSHGKDTRGLIRQHQFSKVEMVNIVDPNLSKEAHQDMIRRAETILELLKLPYRSVLLCSGDTGFGAQKTIDLEVWLPGQNKYREISSVSNCGDFQARRAQIRFKRNDGSKPEYAHTLNGSGLAVGRTLIAIMENYQNEDGSIAVPEVLVPYMKKEVIKK